MMEESGETKEKSRVCVTGGTGFLASWLVMKLLQHGYSVNTTVRSQPPGSRNDVSFLTSLPKAQDRLQIFTADLSDPQSFKSAIQGCVGLFHVAHPMDLPGKESIESMTDRSIRGTLGILQMCLDSGTVKRVVYTSSAATVSMKDQGSNVDGVQVNEDGWSDVEHMKNVNFFGIGYCISKTMTERAVLEFADNNGLDLVTVIPTWIHGPFICPKLPGSVHSSLGLIIGNENQVKYWKRTCFVHTDDVSEAHIHLFEYPEAKGRYICSSVEATMEELVELVSTRYPEFKLKNPETVTESKPDRSYSTKKLLETGFKYKYGLQEMFDEAIECCRKMGFL